MKKNFNFILDVVTKFYEKATNDILIGYHFRNIKDFSTHLPRIAYFWEQQLTGQCSSAEKLSFDLIDVHIPLQIKKGQIGRWVVLFKETLKEEKENQELINKWDEKIEHFKNIFLEHPKLNR